jgi:hypothetical protein
VGKKNDSFSFAHITLGRVERRYIRRLGITLSLLFSLFFVVDCVEGQTPSRHTIEGFGKRR